MYTIRNINRVYASNTAEVVVTIRVQAFLSKDVTETNETIVVPNGAKVSDTDVLAAIIKNNNIDPTTISFAVYTPPVAEPAPVTPVIATETKVETPTAS